MRDGGPVPPRAHGDGRPAARAQRLRQALRRRARRSRCSSCSTRCCRATTRSRSPPTSSSAAPTRPSTCMLGRDVQRAYGMPEQSVLTMPILPGDRRHREDVEVARQPHRRHRPARGDVRPHACACPTRPCRRGSTLLAIERAAAGHRRRATPSAPWRGRSSRASTARRRRRPPRRDFDRLLRRARGPRRGRPTTSSSVDGRDRPPAGGGRRRLRALPLRGAAAASPRAASGSTARRWAPTTSTSPPSGSTAPSCRSASASSRGSASPDRPRRRPGGLSSRTPASRRGRASPIRRWLSCPARRSEHRARSRRAVRRPRRRCYTGRPALGLRSCGRLSKKEAPSRAGRDGL